MPRSVTGRILAAAGRAVQSVKSAVRDPRTQAIFDESRSSAALETVGFAIHQLAQDTTSGAAPQVADFSRQQMELQLKQQQLQKSGKLDVKAAENLRKGAEALERNVQKYVDEAAACRQDLHDFAERLQGAQEELQKLQKAGSQSKEILHTYEPLLAAAQKDYDLAQREFDTTGELGPVAKKTLASHGNTFAAVARVGLYPIKAELQARTFAMIERAEKDPKSDAARLACGNTTNLPSVANSAFMRQEATGVDLRKLAAPGQTLTDEEIIGLYLYTTNEFDDMNKCLLFPEQYQDNPEKMKRLTAENEFCRRGLAKLPNYPSICYPVIRFEDGNYDWQSVYKEGGTFRNKQFWSTGATTGKWARGVATTTCLIFRIYGKTGKDIAVLSAMQGEGNKEMAVPQLAALGKGEVLFAPGTTFKVLAVAEADQRSHGLPTYNITLSEQ